jgi:hypothetical protein
MFTLRAGQAYHYTNNDPEEMEIIFFSAYSDNMAESTNSDEEEEPCCSHYGEHIISNDTMTYCDYLDQLAQDLHDDIALTLDAIEQLRLDTKTSPQLVPAEQLHQNPVVVVTKTIPEDPITAIVNTTLLVKQSNYYYKTINNHWPNNRQYQKTPRPPKEINTKQQKSYYILFATILICVLQQPIYMPRKKTSSNMSTTSTNLSESSIRTR